MSTKIAMGTRVRVLDTDHKDLGLGTYQGEVGFDDDGCEIQVTPDMDELEKNPKILLDSGRTIYGYECWWTPTDEKMEKELAELEAAKAKPPFVIHAWKDAARTGKEEVVELPREKTYPDTLKDFMKEHPEFVSADIGMQRPDADKPSLLGTHHAGKMTMHVG